MADSDKRKSVETDNDTETDEFPALWWTARRMEASDDDDTDEVKEKYRWSSVGFLDDESDGLGEGRVSGEELVSQEDCELEESVRVNKGKVEKVVSDEVLVPSSGWFYMHDDRFRSRRHHYGRRRHLPGNMIGMKLWDSTNEQKWKHDKFEDRSAPESFHQQQRNNQNRGSRYTVRKQFGPHDNFANQNMTSRIVRGRGPVKYKPIVKSNNINPSCKHQIDAKLKESTSSSGFPRLSSHALAITSDECGARMQQLISSMGSSLRDSNPISSSHDILRWRRNQLYSRSNANKYIPRSTQKDVKQHASHPNILLQRKNVSNFSDCH